MQTWCAIGDSFTYLNDHLDETGGIVARGYLSRALDKLPPLCLRNLGINGSTTRPHSLVIHFFVVLVLVM